MCGVVLGNTIKIKCRIETKEVLEALNVRTGCVKNQMANKVVELENIVEGDYAYAKDFRYRFKTSWGAVLIKEEWIAEFNVEDEVEITTVSPSC